MEVEWLILADAAQVVGDKLFLLGGGWDKIVLQQPPPLQHPISIAVAFKVPWLETNKPYPIEIEVQDEDGQILAKIAGRIEAGRPPGVPNGQDQRLQMAVSALLNLNRLGTYVVVARVEGGEAKRISFNAVPGPFFLNQPQAGAA